MPMARVTCKHNNIFFWQQEPVLTPYDPYREYSHLGYANTHFISLPFEVYSYTYLLGIYSLFICILN